MEPWPEPPPNYDPATAPEDVKSGGSGSATLLSPNNFCKGAKRFYMNLRFFKKVGILSGHVWASISKNTTPSIIFKLGMSTLKRPDFNVYFDFST